MYKQILHVSQQAMRIEGAPRHHISITTTNSPSIPGSEQPRLWCSREISHFQRQLRIPLFLFFFSVFAVRFRLLLVAVWLTLPQNLRRFLTGSELCLVLRTTMWLQVKEVATTEFYWLKKCALHFQTSVRSSRFLIKANQK